MTLNAQTLPAGTLTPDVLRGAAEQAGENVDHCLALAAEVGTRLPQPGAGQTWRRWSLLAAAAEGGLTAARVLEAHSDALAILAEAGEPTPAGTWGVFAAEAPGSRLDAEPGVGGTARLVGTKPWCSLGGVLDNALVTARVGAERQLFAVDLRQPSVHPEPADRWVARGLRAVTSAPVRFDDTPARAIGDAGWYLCRAGFAWGGMGVAACWFGAAVALRAALVRAAAKRVDDLAYLSLGTVDTALYAARATLQDAAERIDAGRAVGGSGALLALRVRGTVAQAAEITLTQIGHALGPAPLAFDESHARRVADLEIYVRQHHAERDTAELGRLVVASPADNLG